jgi:hypothetical protein
VVALPGRACTTPGARVRVCGGDACSTQLARRLLLSHTQVYELLHKNYVEDDDAMFRCAHACARASYAVCVAGARAGWAAGARHLKV